jgi:hypothetical protein
MRDGLNTRSGGNELPRALDYEPEGENLGTIMREGEDKLQEL